MAGEFKYTINFDSTATGTGAKAAEEGVKKVTEATKTAGANMGKMGNLANQAGYQIGDFFTQVEMGTSVTRAFSQQAPQLIGAISSAGMVSMSTAMALSGIGVAIPILTTMLPMLGRAFNDVATTADDFATKLTENVKKASGQIADINTKRIDEANTKARQAIEDQITLSKKYDETGKAEDKAITAALSNAEKNRVAQMLVAEALGIQVDQYAAIAAAAEAEAAKRAEAANQAIDGENEKLVAANHEAWIASQRQGLREVELQQRQRELEAAKAVLETLRQQSAEYEKQSKAHVAFGDTNGAVNKEFAGMRFNAMGAILATQQGLVDDQERKVQAAQKEVNANAAAFEAAMRMVTDQSSATAVQIDTLETTLQSDNLNARAAAVVDQGKALVGGLTDAMAQLEPTTAAGIAAKEGINRALADAKITADEMPGLITNLTQMLGSVQTGMTAVHGNLESVKAIMANFAVRFQSNEAELQRIARQLAAQGSLSASPLPAR